MCLTNHSLSKSIILISFALIFIAFSSCDSPSTSVEKSQPDNNAIHKTADFFAHSPDSVNSMLTAAMDTLRKDNSIYPFISKFIEKRGLPVWNKASGSYREGTPVFTVPVRDAQERKITGIVTIVVKDDNPHYEWTPRGAKMNGKLSEGLEVMMWVYEKRVFGKTHTSDGRRIETKPSTSAKTGNVMSTMDEPCGRVCLPDGGSCGDWEGDCGDGGGGDGDGDGWDDGGDLGPPDYGDEDSDGGSGGGGGGQGDNRDNDEPECENNAVNIPFPGVLDPDEEDNPYPGPSGPPPCEEGEEDDDSAAEISLKPSFKNNSCLSSVYNQAGKAPAYQNILKNFDGEFSVANLTFSADNQLPRTSNARTYPPQNYMIEIAFNANN